MSELKSGDRVILTIGSSAKIIKELGRGGQGIVYLVELAGKQMALKWYITPPEDNFYKNLKNNIEEKAPSDAFLWPEYLTIKEEGSYGYIMPLRPEGYYEFGNYLLAKKKFNSFEAVCNAAMKICEGFSKLHLKGLSYQDLNDGNFFIEPNSGDVLICDNDNVMPQGEKSGIMGKARYMAPEIVMGNTPDKYSDRYSLAVILFLLFYGNHPLEGAKVLGCPCMTEKNEKRFYGSEALFIYDENDKSNLPVRGVHNNVLKRWGILPTILKQQFQTEFSQDHLHNPKSRLIEVQWQKIIQQLRDSILICPHCHNETFVSNVKSDNVKCSNCGKTFTIDGSFDIDRRKILLSPGKNIYIDLDNRPDAKVVQVQGSKYPVQIKNTTTSSWSVETQSGKIKLISPGDLVPLKAGLKIAFSGSLKEKKGIISNISF